MLGQRHVPRCFHRCRQQLVVVGRGQRRNTSKFNVVQHVVKAQHTRDRAAGTLGSRDTLRLHVNQYVPKNDTSSTRDEGVTIIGAHANGFPKEMCEPFWDDLEDCMRAQGRSIRSIWIADIASQGQSGILNEEVLGPEPSWLDHARDLLFLINQFQEEMPHPIIGIGNSVGASHLAHLALLHPRLLDGLILVDPILQTSLLPHKQFARLSTLRRDTWPSRAAATAKFRSNAYYQSWDPRVLDKWLAFGLRDVDQGPAGNSADGPPVTLSTTVAQEVYFYLRPKYFEERLLQDDRPPDDHHSEDMDGLPFWRPEMDQLYRQLPEIKPSTLYVFGKESPASPPEYRKAKMDLTGSGNDGNGGVAAGRVEEVVLNCGHLVGMERPRECAEVCSRFVDREMTRWEGQERRRAEVARKLTREERVGINGLWKRNLGVEDRRK